MSDENNNNFYVGLEDWTEKSNFKDAEAKIKLLFKKYLLLDNINFLFGTGSSIHLGAESIQEIPECIEKKIQAEAGINSLYNCLKLSFQKNLIKGHKYLVWEDKRYKLNEDIKEKLSKIKIENDKFLLDDALALFEKEDEKNEIIRNLVGVKLEDFLNFLNALKYLMSSSEQLVSAMPNGEGVESEKLERLIYVIKQEMFEMCDVDKIEISDNRFLANNPAIQKIIDAEGKYTYHRSFLTSILQRPLNLRRANIFTLNYDLAFEYAFDELGVQYINGFSGFNERNFRPEIYNYDFFYPGDITEGKVRRVERVVKYYKLHGSINWIHKNKNKNNPYGLYEEPIELIRHKIENDAPNLGEIMIYPTSYKKEFTLNFPYSELFRRFADRLQQPESVLFVVGYSFYDEHINDIIYQALANPSFTLIIIDFAGTKSNAEISRLQKLGDPRIIIAQGNDLGDFKKFAKAYLPAMEQSDTRAMVQKTLDKLFETAVKCECLLEKSDE